MMNLIHFLIDMLRDPGPVILSGGYPVLALIVFLETGAMIFFLPGDSLLVTAGFYAAATHLDAHLDIVLLSVILIPCAILGDTTSYWIGKKTGPLLFNRPRSRFFRPEYVEAAQRFYDRHGGKAVILARFMPLVRTFVPVVAGVARMPYMRFLAFNVIGGAAWVLSMTLLGYFLGTTFPGLVKRIEIVIIVVVLLSITPGVVTWLKARRAARRAAAPS